MRGMLEATQMKRDRDRRVTDRVVEARAPLTAFGGPPPPLCDPLCAGGISPTGPRPCRHRQSDQPTISSVHFWFSQSDFA